MSNAPLMPKATAVWLVDNTALTFDQVAEFTKMHPLEVRAIADGDAAQGIKGMDPISTGQLSREEIERGEADPDYRLKLGESKVVLPPLGKKKGPRYTPVSRRHERPSAILWRCAAIRNSRTRRSCASSAPPRQRLPASATAPTGTPRR